MTNKKYSLTLQSTYAILAWGTLVVLMSMIRVIVSYMKFCLIHNPLLNLLVRIHFTIHHDSTYKASDDFPVQKTIFRDSVALQLHPHLESVLPIR